MKRFRTLARRLAYRSGALGWKRAKHSRTLTVAMFHRVIDRADPEFEQADSTYTMPADLFERLLDFFRDHYSVIGLGDVRDAADRLHPLPDHPLLITFDDGWADNLRYAAPLLRHRGLPAVIFVAAEPLLSPADTWWQQQIFDAASRGNLAAFERRMSEYGRAGASDNRPGSPLDLICRIGQLGEDDRSEFLEAIVLPTSSSRMMLAPTDLAKLAAAGIAIGSHGYTHLPLTSVSDLAAEIRGASEAIAALTGDEASAAALSCPHGRYDARVLAAARANGIRLVFTSDPHLNRTEGGMIAPERPLGRILMEAAPLADGSGRFDPSAAATWLWHRPSLPRSARP